MPTLLDTAPVPLVDQPLGCKAAKLAAPRADFPFIDIIDMRQTTVDLDLKHEILSMFNPPHGPRKLPTLLLYDEAGLQLFEHVGWPHTPHVLRASR